MAAIGVDFGNTYCRVGVFRSNGFEIIHSETQSRHIPCIVSFKGSGTDMMVGDLAQNRVVENIETTFFCPKRLIGRTYEEITQQIGDNRWPFSVKEGGEKKPIFQVAYPDKKLDLHPIQIYSAVLYKARELATAFLQENVVRAVITIPINCGKPFIEDAKRSAEMAGFMEVNLIEKPLSATIAYSLTAAKRTMQYVIAIHLGGGSLGVSVVNISANGIQPIFSDGDPDIGGVNIDTAIVKWLHQKLVIPEDPSGKTSVQLSSLCENAKKNLASCKKTSIKLQALGISDSIGITQDDILEMEDVRNMLGKMKGVMDKAVAAIPPTAKTEVILVGGSTRLKCVRDVIDSFGIKPYRILSADEVAVTGAAALASKLWPMQSSEQNAGSDLKNMQLLATVSWTKAVTGGSQACHATDYIDDQFKDLGDRSALLNEIESDIYTMQRVLDGLDTTRREGLIKECKKILDWVKREPIPTMKEIANMKDDVERMKSNAYIETVSGEINCFSKCISYSMTCIQRNNCIVLMIDNVFPVKVTSNK